jgi:hypothetical protein
LTSGKNEYLGADDRAGVYACLILATKHNIPALFCDYEERGGLGAHESTIIYEQEISKVLFLIEFDRRGEKDAVYYNAEPEHFRRFISKYGFRPDFGTMSDISIIGSRLDICAVNLSIGYQHEHTKSEYLDLSTLNRTIRRANALIKETKRNPRRFRKPKWDPYDYDTPPYYANTGKRKGKRKRKKRGKHTNTQHSNITLSEEVIDGLIEEELTRYAANGDTPPLDDAAMEQYRQNIRDYYGI